MTKKTKELIKKALLEDLGQGDITTRSLVPQTFSGSAKILAKDFGILCGGTVVCAVFHFADPKLKVHAYVQDGKKIVPGQLLFSVSGRLSSILYGERTALNFLGHLSGIATLTNQFVQKVKGTGTKILDTRKTTPLWRELEKYAVRIGGGENHRFGLWDEVLVKDNHLWALRKLKASKTSPGFLNTLKTVLEKFQKSKILFEIEVRSVNELKELLEAGIWPNRFLLDHFSIRDLRNAVKLVHRFFSSQNSKKIKQPLLEASGNIHLGNVRQIAQTGVDRISVGALTHSAPVLDTSLKLFTL